MPLELYSPDPNRIIHKTQIDFVNRDSFETPIHLVQGDDRLPIVEVSLYKSGEPYSVPEGADGNIRWKKPAPSSHYVYNPLLGVNSDRTKVYLEITQQMTTGFGRIQAVLEFIVSGLTAMSAHLPIILDRNPIQPDDILDENEVKTLQAYVADAKASADEAGKSKTSSEESARTASESESRAAEATKRAEAAKEAAKISEDISTQNAETSSQAATKASKAQTAAEKAQRAIENMTVGAETLPTGEDATVVKSVDENGVTHLQFGLPRGDTGEQGLPGTSPTVDVYKEGKVAHVTITDAEGPHEFEIKDGEDGAGAVESVNGQTGVVTLKAGDVGAYTTGEVDGALGKKADLVNGRVSDAQLGYATRNIVYYVDAAGGSDETGDGTEARPFASLPHALSLLPKNMNGHDYYIYLSEGVHHVPSGLLSITGFMHGGYGGVRIWRNPKLQDPIRPVIDAEIHILTNDSHVNLTNINVQYTGGEPKNQYIYVSGNTGNVSISRMDITDDISTKLGAMQITSNGTVSLNAVRISGAPVAAVYCGENQRMNITGCSGSGNAVCYKVGNSAMARPDTLYLNGSSMEGTVEIQKLYNSIVFKNGVMV